MVNSFGIGISAWWSSASGALPLQRQPKHKCCIGWLQVQGSSSTVLVATVDFVLMQGLDIIRETQMDVVVLFLPRSLEIIKGCYAYNVPRFLTFYAAAPLLVTFIMFAMTLYKCVLTLYHADHRVMPVWRLFLRDGIVWFVLVFAAAGSEVLIWTMRRETLKQLLVVYDFFSFVRSLGLCTWFPVSQPSTRVSLQSP
ncbi:hypothetical protein B0H14DRAFT_2650643 [Mycena olivaceomarginata]|nr:hypothetical protein B0H14DRAFT_2650643 [Mycena olivaceomarginata]